MLAFVIVLQVLVALFLIGVVLLQPGNRGGASAALGGAGSDTVFGGRGANTFLSKLTFGAAVCFMITNFAISFMFSSDGGEKSVLDKLPQTSSSKAPVAPDAVPAGSEEAPVEGEVAKPASEAAPANDADKPAAEEAAPNE